VEWNGLPNRVLTVLQLVWTSLTVLLVRKWKAQQGTFRLRIVRPDLPDQYFVHTRSCRGDQRIPTRQNIQRMTKNKSEHQKKLWLVLLVVIILIHPINMFSQ
jgi:hypothetical protein